MADLKKCPYKDCDKPADSGHLRSIHGIVDAKLRDELLSGKLKPGGIAGRLKKASKTATGSRRGRPQAADQGDAPADDLLSGQAGGQAGDDK